MACILLLFVISSRVQQVEPYRVPQADVIFTCEQSRTFSPPVVASAQRQTVDLFARVLPEPSRVMAAGAFETELRKLSHADRLSVRLQLDVAVDDRSCPRLATAIVERLNATYETAADARAAEAAPAAYLLLDIVRVEAHRNRSQ